MILQNNVGKILYYKKKIKMMNNKKYIYLTKQIIDKCGGIEAIQNWYKKCGIIVEVIIIPDKVESLREQ